MPAGRSLVLVLVSLSAACGGDRTMTGSTGPPPPDTALTPLTFDLRFKGVGVLASDTDVARDELFETGEVTAMNYAGTPLEIGAANCVPGVDRDCVWFAFAFDLPSRSTGLTTIYRSDVLAAFAADLDTTAESDTVITSLDLEPADSIFAVAEFVTPAAGGYQLVHRVVSPAALQAAASQEGTAGRVITAVAFDAGQVHYLSYSWQRAASAVYEAQVVSATPLTIGAAAQTLSASGYTITAFGGDSVDGLLLVGTRVQGSAAPIGVIVNPSTPSALDGYATVALFLRVAIDTGIVTTWVAQR